MQFTENQIGAVRLLVLGHSRESVARTMGMSDTSFSRFMRRIYVEAGTRSTMETAVKLSLSGVLGLTLADFPARGER